LSPGYSSSQLRARSSSACRGEQTYRGKPTSYWTRALTDGNAGTTAATLELLQRGGTHAVPVLIEALASEDAHARLSAAAALGAIGKDAVPALIGSAPSAGSAKTPSSF
jgi:HEAT repeat protein